MNVPMNDLSIQYHALQPELDRALAGVIERCSFIQGPAVEAFEKAFAEYCGTRHCVAVSNGTDALKLVLVAAGIGPGDEVITSPHTFGATVEAILQVGARPVLADIDAGSFTVDPEQVRARLTPRTRVLMPVHLYGQTAEMEPLLAMATERKLIVVEDAAQAHGARYRGKRAGSLGLAGCFSFYPGKNLGAYGDAGGITTSDDRLAERLRQLRNHGQDPKKKFYYSEVGYNHRMDGFQGAVLGVKLPHLDAGNARRREIAARYDAGLAGLPGLVTPAVAPHGEHVYHLYVIRVTDRERLAAALKENGVQTAVQYPNPLHLTPAYASLGFGAGDLPECERACREILSLPMFPELTDAQVDHVIDQVRRFFA
ncbi:MAG: DegT/DnrJ/EryC1/StrS family aminotransferase [Candidatus Latescibacterota bacterium]|jgi:dTDP-4-amino-4,6-dideoxygalactose transaminase